MTRPCCSVVAGCRLLLAVLLAVSGTFAGPPGHAVALDPKVEPAQVNVNLAPGDTRRFTAGVTTGIPPIPRLDVLFLLDVTSSMRPVLDQSKQSARSILQAVGDQIPDSAFGVASFADYPRSYNFAGYAAEYGAPGDYPWRLDADIGRDRAGVVAAIQGLRLMDGRDGPEPYGRALYESRFVGWRSGAKRVIVLFGDAPAHDPDFYRPQFGRNFGVDPGRDEVAGTADDLRFAEVVAQLKADGIEVIPVFATNAGPEARFGFDYVAQQTGGKAYPIESAAAVPTAVVQGLQTSTATIGSLSLRGSGVGERWVTTQPSQHVGVGGGVTRAFDVALRVPPGTEPGRKNFRVEVVGDGAVLGVIQVTLDVQEALATSISHKRELIRYLSEPHLVDPHPFREAFPDAGSALRADYGPEEGGAEGFLRRLEQQAALGDPSAGESSALKRLLLAEDGFKELYDQEVKVDGLIAEDWASIAGVAFSLYDLSRKVAVYAKGAPLGAQQLYDLLALELGDKALGLFRLASGYAAGLIEQPATSEALETGTWYATQYMQYRLTRGESVVDAVLDGSVNAIMTRVMMHYFITDTSRAVERATRDADDLRRNAGGSEELAREDRLAEINVRAALQKVAFQVDLAKSNHADLKRGADMMKAVADLAGVGKTGLAAAGVSGLLGLATATAVIGADTYRVGLAGLDVFLVARGTDLRQEFDGVGQLAFGRRTVGEIEPGATRLMLAPARAAPRESMTGAARPSDEARADLGAASANYRGRVKDLTERLRRPGTRLGLTDLTSLRDADRTLDVQVGLLSASLAADHSTPSDLRRTLHMSLVDLTLAQFGFYLGLAASVSDPGVDLSEASSRLDGALGRLLSAATSVPLRPTGAYVTVTTMEPREVVQGERTKLRVRLTNIGSEPSKAISVRVPDISSVAQAQVREVGGLQPGLDAEALIDVQPIAQGTYVIPIHVTAENGGASGRAVPILVRAPATVAFGLLALLALTLAGIAVPTVLVIRSRRSSRIGVAPVVRLPPQAQSRTNVWALPPGETVIGRAPECTIAMADEQVSRRHAALLRRGYDVILRDLRSRNGTFVNGARVWESRLVGGDIIQVGATRLRFEALPEPCLALLAAE